MISGSKAPSEHINKKKGRKMTSKEKREKMCLDKNHLALLQDPKNLRDNSLYTPEGYSTDHKKDL
jgi:hypothetical protein